MLANTVFKAQHVSYMESSIPDEGQKPEAISQLVTPEEIVVLAELAVRGSARVEDYHSAETKAAAKRIGGYLENDNDVPNHIQAVMNSNKRVLAEPRRSYYEEREIRRNLSGAANRFDVRP